MGAGQKSLWVTQTESIWKPRLVMLQLKGRPVSFRPGHAAVKWKSKLHSGERLHRKASIVVLANENRIEGIERRLRLLIELI